jgi:folate-dependent phosphoribosylglycinamide formyltransferase PurN
MVEWVNSSIIYLIYCKNLYKYHNVSSPSTTIKKILKSKETLGRKIILSLERYRGNHVALMGFGYHLSSDFLKARSYKQNNLHFGEEI